MKKIFKKFGKTDDAENEKQDQQQEQKEEQSTAQKVSASSEGAQEAPGKQALLLRRPWITEKAAMISQQDQYIFMVEDSCNKSEAKKLIEQVYGVNVIKVRSMNMPAKSRRLGASQGSKSGYKKVIVTLQEGQTIDVLPH